MAQRPANFTLNTSHPLAQGLVFAGLGQSPSGTHFHDSSLYSSHGTLTNMEIPTDWEWSTALNRLVIAPDGTNEHVLVPGITSLTPPFAMAAWYKTNTTGSSQFLVGVDNSGATGNWHMLMHDGSIGPAAGSNDAGSSAKSSVTLDAANWIAVAGNWASTTSRQGFGNGTAGATNTTSKVPTGLNRCLVGGGFVWLNGAIADVMIWGRVLTDTEIKQLADPSNVMLSGLLQYPRRKWWPARSGAAPAGNRRRRVLIASSNL